MTRVQAIASGTMSVSGRPAGKVDLVVSWMSAFVETSPASHSSPAPAE